MNRTKFDQLTYVDPAYKDLKQPYYPIYKPKYLPYKVHNGYNEKMYYSRFNEPSYIDLYNNRRSGKNLYNMYKK